MSLPNLSEGALEFLDFSEDLAIETQRQTSATVERGDLVSVWGSVVALAGPYVLDDSPGAERIPNVTGGFLEADAVLYCHAGGPELPGGALAKGDRVFARGLRYSVEGFGSWAEAAGIVVAALKAERQPTP